MATTKHLPLQQRVKAALSYHYPTVDEVDAIMAFLKREHPRAGELDPRPLGTVVRCAFYELFISKDDEEHRDPTKHAAMLDRSRKQRLKAAAGR